MPSFKTPIADDSGCSHAAMPIAELFATRSLRVGGPDVIASYAMAKLLSVSIPDDLMREAEAVARASGKTKSELVRDALRRQIDLEQFRELQRYGRGRAEERGIGPEDVERLVDEVRTSRRT